MRSTACSARRSPRASAPGSDERTGIAPQYSGFGPLNRNKYELFRFAGIESDQVPAIPDGGDACQLSRIGDPTLSRMCHGGPAVAVALGRTERLPRSMR